MRSPAVLLIVVAASGCIRPELVLCENGLACPAGTACDERHRTCTNPDQLTACENVADLERCTATGVPDGACHDGVCLPIECGNVRVDPGEVCDDGNLIIGDGCRPDCASDESCGNGLPDFGEACDDGNALSHDGCDSRCVIESLRWTRFVQPPDPNLYGFAYAYDTTRERFVVFGGSTGNLIGIDTRNVETREWDGNAWLTIETDLVPSPRIGATMAYDPIRRVSLLFGGEGNGDTWLWDGTRWTEHLGPAPPFRTAGTMVWDGVRHVIVLFGGYAGASTDGAPLADTWLWDGNGWTQAIGPSPPARGDHAMAFDPLRGAIVLYGGSNGGNLTDTWLWNGTWSAVQGASGPGNRIGAFMMYDPTLDAVVLIGSFDRATVDVWSWTGSQWLRLADTPYADRSYTGGMYRRGTGLALFGGLRFVDSIDEPVRFVNGSWSEARSPIPPTTAPGVAVSDRWRRNVLMFGGGKTDNTVTDTWELASSRWRRRMPSTIPVAQSFQGLRGYALAHDSRRGLDVLLTDFGQTLFAWDGEDWLQRSTAPYPPLRGGATLTFDVERAACVLFGGRAPLADPRNDTWTWNGSWTEVISTPRPPPSENHAVAYDDHRQVLVAYLGTSVQTWEWSGGWTNATPTTSQPGTRFDHALVYDPRRRETVLYGGGGSNNDVWSWNGTRWSRQFTTGAPLIGAHALAYDGDRVIAITTGGTYSLAWWSPGGDDDCRANLDLDGDGRAGCADPDCWPVCTPTCPPGAPCPAEAPRCGDGVCSSIETCRVCSIDCACPQQCGDNLCAASETANSCPGDCTP